MYLILTLNHIYPDYDFSLLRAHHFKKEEGVSAIEETIDAHLLEVSKVGLVDFQMLLHHSMFTPSCLAQSNTKDTQTEIQSFFI